MTYYPPDHHETEAERLEHEHDMRLAREDRRQDHAPLPDKEPKIAVRVDGSVPPGEIRVEQDGRVVGRIVNLSGDALAVLPRDLDEWPDALARVERLADDYASVEVDRLPPMGACHWLVIGHRADGGVDVFRVGSHGSLMPWGAR